MDEQAHTQATLDQLADLFLTDPLSPSTTVASPPLNEPTPVNTNPDQRPLPLGDPLEPLGPVRMRPETPKSDPPTPNRAKIGQKDSPAPSRLDLIWGSNPGVDPPQHRTAALVEADNSHVQEPDTQSSIVEAVFLGNLPGFGGPWLTQYAQRQAQQHGPVAVLHLDVNQIEVELVLPRDLSQDHSLLDTAPWQKKSNSIEQVLQDLAHWEACPVRVWLIHLTTPVTSQMGSIANQLPYWTLLCGADDAAVVAAYRLVKQVLDMDENPDGSAGEPRVGVMILGSDEQASRAAARKLIETSSRFLTTPVEMIGWQKRMEPGFVHPVGSFRANPSELWPMVKRISARVQAGDSRESFKPPLGADAETNLRNWRGCEVMEPHDWIDDPTEKATRRHQRARQIDQPTLDRPDTAVHRSHRPRPWLDADLSEDLQSIGVDTDQRQPIMDHPPDLGSFLPGYGTTLKARSPRHPDTQLMIDPQGCIHLLRQVRKDDLGKEPVVLANKPSPEAVSETLRAAVVDLIGARTWVREHLSLLQLTERQLRIDAQATPVLHLFTEHAKLAVSLVEKLDGLVVIHLLQEIRVGSERTWHSVDLN